MNTIFYFIFLLTLLSNSGNGCNTQTHLGEKSQEQDDSGLLDTGYDEKADSNTNTDSEEEYCGVQKYPQSLFPAKRILGGGPAANNSWPWHVRIVNTDRTYKYQLCGGTLIKVKNSPIKSDIVVTAAHCVTRLDDQNKTELIEKALFRVVLGDHFMGQPNWYFHTTNPDLSIRVDHMVTYDRYDILEMHHDVAVIKIEVPVNFTDTVQPICTPKQGAAMPKKTDQCVTVGWGVKEDKSVSPVLKQLQMIVHKDTKCTGWGPWTRFGKYFEKGKMICAKAPRNANGTHQEPRGGDSGGSLACLRNGKWFIFGVFGGNADDEEWASYYMRYSVYASWIKRIAIALTDV